MICLQITNLQQLTRAHNDLLAKNQRIIDESVQRGAKHAKDFINRYPGFKPRSGNLQKKTQTKIIRLGSGRLLKIQNDLKYANSIDGGARPHPIVAVNAPYLHFFWKKKGRWVRTKRVRHPGNRAYKTFYRATNSTYRLMRQDLEHRMSDLAKHF